jgi:cytochrome c
MDSFELNKIAGAVLATALGVMGLGIVSDFIYAPIEAEQPGYVITVAVSDDGHGAVEEVVLASIADRLQTADASRGQSTAKKCQACHSFDKGGTAKVGPNLWNVVGRQMASFDGFGYSDAMKGMGEAWAYESLDQFLESPKSAIKGTSMAFAGLKKPDQRADVIAFLRSLSDDPIALPAVATEEPQADDAAETPAAEEAPAADHN